jgi:hypothetical protein
VDVIVFVGVTGGVGSANLIYCIPPIIFDSIINVDAFIGTITVTGLAVDGASFENN